MAVSVVVGAQWGDEGKGKIVDLLSEQADIIVRYQGGANAGHTIQLGGKQYVLHLVPSGILHPDCTCVIGNGVVVDPEALAAEIQFLTDEGIETSGRLMISDRAHLIFPYHKLLDQLHEEQNTVGRIGTTGRGIGPAYVDKFNRQGIRLVDILHPERFEEKIRLNVREKNQIISNIYHHEPLDEEKVVQTYREYAEFMKPFLADTGVFLHRAIREGKRILLEGAQGTLLDIDHGTYPFVTSSNPVSGGACSGAGIAPNRIDQVVGVLKAYTTRVGEGPFPTELQGDEGKYFREKGKEYGATTGRPRRCGWFDAVIARYAVQVNGITQLAITKLDVLDQLDEIRICRAYEYQGKQLEYFPADLEILWKCTPVYESVPGWKKSLQGVQTYDELPENARLYLEKIEQITGVPIQIVSVGANRKETIFK